MCKYFITNHCNCSKANFKIDNQTGEKEFICVYYYKGRCNENKR